jgi:hypothetical protein
MRHLFNQHATYVMVYTQAQAPTGVCQPLLGSQEGKEGGKGNATL